MKPLLMLGKHNATDRTEGLGVGSRDSKEDGVGKRVTIAQLLDAFKKGGIPNVET